MNHKKSAKLLKICGWIGVVLLAAVLLLTLLSPKGSSALLAPVLILLAAAVAVIIIGAILAYAYMRCPHCDKSLYVRGLKPNFCLHCGKPVEW